MSFTLLQVGSMLKTLNPQGGQSAALTLPTGVSLAINRVPRFATFQHLVVVVNTPTRPITVDDTGTVRLLTPSAPGSAVALTGPNSGTLSGTYRVVQTYLIKDALGNVISESDFGPAMTTAVTISNKKLLATFAVSSEQVGATRLYRTVTNGSVYFHWADIDGNTVTTFESDSADALLDTVAAPARGAAPDLTLIAEWQGRLWGVDREDIDNLRYTEAGTAYAWSALNTLPIPHVGQDRFGITALVARRNVLHAGRQNRITQVVGETTTNIRPIGIIENCGILSQESCVVFKDSLFFLWHDGVYQLNDDGLVCLSDMAGVRSWFTTDDYFNRGMFGLSFAVFDPIHMSYKLFLCAPGQTMTNRWIEYNLRTGKFYGPHLTNAFAPTCAVLVRGTNDQDYPMVGSREGYLSQDTEQRSDWGLVPIPMRVTMAAHDLDEPNLEKYFGQVLIHTEEEDGGTLTVSASAGDLNHEDDPTMTHDLTQARELLDRVGTGKWSTLVFENAEINRPVTIYGYEIDPTFVTGRR